MAIASIPATFTDPLRLKRWLSVQGGGFALLLLASFASAVYWGIAEERQADLRQEVRRLALTAADQLPLIVHEFHERGNSYKFRPDQEVLTGGDGGRQRLRWYDRNRRVVEDRGDLPMPAAVPSAAVPPAAMPPAAMPPAAMPPAVIPPASAAERNGLHWQGWSGGVMVWQPVYTRPRQGGSGGTELRGYVEVGLSDQAVRAELARLRRGLLLGTITALLVALLVGRSMLRRSLAPLQAQVAGLQRFTAEASHELRHPLTLLRTLLATAAAAASAARQPAEEVTALLGRLDQLAARMGMLLDDLLLLARHDQHLGEGASQRHQWRRFDLLELLDDLLDLYRPGAAPRGVALLLESELAELMVWGEPERLQQLFTNVLVNAIRHSPDGAVVTVRTGRQAGRWRLEIIDQGEGIAPPDRERVFERFWRGAAAVGEAGEEAARSGLGLAIARAIARGHGGEIAVAESQPGRCVIRVLLPVA